MNTQVTSAPTFTKFNVPLPSHLGENIVITLPWDLTVEEAKTIFQGMYGHVEVEKTEEEIKQERIEIEQERLKWEKSKFEKAVKLKESEYKDFNGYCGVYYSEEFGLNYGYFYSLDEFYEWWEDEYGVYSELEEEDKEYYPEYPKYVWACKEQYPYRYTAERITEESYEDLFEDACESVSSDSEAELDKALDKYYEANSSIVGYVPNYSLAVLLDEI